MVTAVITFYSWFKKMVTLKKGGSTEEGCEKDDFGSSDQGGAPQKQLTHQYTERHVAREVPYFW
jgi:hypothetical protein